jgi:trans-2,3-dihydro-3-hydroxyanthranilate isomerase
MAVRNLNYVLCDVFTDVPLAGNQLAVFTDARELDQPTMQALARELNYSESAFVVPKTVEDADARIRIFTPEGEVPFAGHPTLGCAFVLGEPLQSVMIRLETGSGVVPVELRRDGTRIAFGWMEQPLPRWEPVANADDILAAVGAAGSSLPVERYDMGMPYVFLELSTAQEVAGLQPDMAALARATSDGVSCFSRDGVRWKLRMFAPADGVPEDPASGATAGALAVHLARHGRIRFGDEIEISQGVELRRPSMLYAVAEGSPDRLERVRMGGSAVIVAHGEFTLH